MKSHPELLKQQLEESLKIKISGSIDNDLTYYINDLIQNDFQKLIAILYKVDIDEEKLKNILQHQTGKDTGEIIAKLIIERQLQKLETRKHFK